MRPFLALLLVFSMTGCGAKPLNEHERALLTYIASRFESLGERYRELERFGSGKEEGVNFVSYSRDLADSNSVPLMNPNYFWVKVSLTKNPIDPADLHPPVVTIFIPHFDKYLKLRMATENRALMAELAEIFYRTAVDAGGTNPVWGRTKTPGRSRGRRSFAG